jgi:hypothetical protein
MGSRVTLVDHISDGIKLNLVNKTCGKSLLSLRQLRNIHTGFVAPKTVDFRFGRFTPLITLWRCESLFIRFWNCQSIFFNYEENVLE